MPFFQQKNIFRMDSTDLLVAHRTNRFYMARATRTSQGPRNSDRTILRIKNIFRMDSKDLLFETRINRFYPTLTTPISQGPRNYLRIKINAFVSVKFLRQSSTDYSHIKPTASSSHLLHETARNSSRITQHA